MFKKITSEGHSDQIWKITMIFFSRSGFPISRLRGDSINEYKSVFRTKSDICRTSEPADLSLISVWFPAQVEESPIKGFSQTEDQKKKNLFRSQNYNDSENIVYQ